MIKHTVNQPMDKFNLMRYPLARKCCWQVKSLDLLFGGDNLLADNVLHIEKNNHSLMPTKSIIYNRVIHPLLDEK